jgi:hypothetical protein
LAKTTLYLLPMLEYKKHWLFKLKEDYSFKSDWIYIQLKEDLKFCDECHKLWLEIKKDGMIIVKKDYAWDGCSPKLSIFDLFWVGTPDGALDEEKPITYYASLVHDALGQFSDRPEMPFNRQQRDLIFKEMLEQSNFKLSWFYYQAVAFFGPLYSLFF